MVKYAGIYSSPLKPSGFIECSLKELKMKDLVFFGASSYVQHGFVWPPSSFLSQL